MRSKTEIMVVGVGLLIGIALSVGAIALGVFLAGCGVAGAAPSGTTVAVAYANGTTASDQAMLLSDAHGGGVVAEWDSLGSSIRSGLLLQNGASATAGTPSQYSPGAWFCGHGWDGVSADHALCAQLMAPTSGSDALPELAVRFSVDGTATNHFQFVGSEHNFWARSTIAAGSGKPAFHLLAGNTLNADDVLLDVGHGGPELTALSLTAGGTLTALRYGGVSQQAVAAPNVVVNCAAGELTHVSPVTSNLFVSIATACTVPNEACTVVFAKDASASAWAIFWSGANVRADAGTNMLPSQGSLTTFSFRCDDRLPTPSWVEVGVRSVP